MVRPMRLLRWGLVGGGAIAVLGYAALYMMPLPGAPAAQPLVDSTKVLDREGRPLYDSAGPADAHHTYLPLDEMPDRLKQAVIATEDASFYSHPGVDVRAILRAALTDLREGA